jgi:hypothetical protein
MTVPIFTSPGRSGFGPQLSLSYDSGAGNGPFGFGWSLSLPTITHKTDKGLPRYWDSEESDVFILSGSEDLVPELLAPDEEPLRRTIANVIFVIRRCHPRIEGLFARIEQWTDQSNGEIHWRSISKDNITTLYGKTAGSRIFDPYDPLRIFSWLISESYDDKGNAVCYEYKTENSQGVDPSLACERNRSEATRSSNRYLKRIKYGNQTPRKAQEDLSQRDDWLFEVVCDYGEHYREDDECQPTAIFAEDNHADWQVRQDAFSSYRAGFEVRTYRLCQRALMFHHFPDELGVQDYLVRATHFQYRQSPIASFMTAAVQSGYSRRGDGTYFKRSMPALEFEYSEAILQDSIHEIDSESLENLPYGLDGSNYQWIDLDGEGTSGILTEQAGAWYYKRNLSPVSANAANGDGNTSIWFAPTEVVAAKPSSAQIAGGHQQLLDLAGDGNLDLVHFDDPAPGFFERTEDGGWEQFTSFTSLPRVHWKDPNLKFVDLTGDGHADVLITEDEVFTWYPSLARAGFGPSERTRQTLDEEDGPRLVFADGTESIYLADMSGDGL